jgi:hypothetical protein
MELFAGLLIFWLIIGSIVLFGTIFWIWMLIDVAGSKALDETEKIVWVLIIVFTHSIGALIYFFVKWLPNRKRI